MVSNRKKIVVFGAGNIGRSFIGQLFSLAAYEVVFIDIDPVIISELNRKGSYSVVVKQDGTPDKTIQVSNVRGVDGNDADSVCREIAGAALLATSVGKGALPHIFPLISDALNMRWSESRRGIDIIIAENIRDAAAWFRAEIFPSLAFPDNAEKNVGLVETSIGKMVPIMTDNAEDRLTVFAEPYNTLIVDEKGFRNGLPDVAGLKPVRNIQAFVDRKLFIHNLGHAAVAYLGFAAHSERRYIYEHMRDKEIADTVRRCMRESAAGLAAEYPGELEVSDLHAHIEDLIGRFGNSALKDTVYRVGRDLARKLGPDDRLCGALKLTEKHHLANGTIAAVIANAFAFCPPDADGRLFPPDAEFRKRVEMDGPGKIIEEMCGLTPELNTRVIGIIAGLRKDD